jgi:hypothetical protein
MRKQTESLKGRVSHDKDVETFASKEHNHNFAYFLNNATTIVRTQNGDHMWHDCTTMKDGE